MKTKKEPKFDLKLLKDTLSIQSHHSKDNDTKIMNFIKAKVKELKCEYTEDSYGNIYVTKGKTNVYPCIVAHTDTVHKILHDFKVYQHNDILFAFSSDTMQQTGIGGDDKVGVSIALNTLKDFNNLKVIFFRHEEIGCKGSTMATMTYFENCSFVLQADRRGNTDFIINASGTELSSKEFQETIKPIVEKHRYKYGSGMMTDVMRLKEKNLSVCAANISCGYYLPHTDNEVVSIEDVTDCYEMISEIILSIGDKKWLHKLEDKYKPAEYSRNRSGGYYETREWPFNKSYDEIEKPFKDDSQTEINFPRTNHQSIGGFSKQSSLIDREVDIDEEDPEDILEEIDIQVQDMKNTIEDWEEFRLKMIEKKGKL